MHDKFLAIIRVIEKNYFGRKYFDFVKNKKIISYGSRYVTSRFSVCACPVPTPQLMSAIQLERWMHIISPQINPLHSLMCQDPQLIRERLFQGIDTDYNVRFFFT